MQGYRFGAIAVVTGLLVALLGVCAPEAVATPELRSLLVTQTDFPGTGWTILDASDAPAGTPNNHGPMDTQPPGCDNTDKMRPANAVGTLGMNSATGETVSAYLSTDRSIIESTRDWLARCGAFTVTSNEANGSIQTWPTPIPGASPDGLGYTMKMEPVGITVVTYMTTVNDMVVFATGFAQGALNKAALDTVFGRQLTKVGGTVA